MAWRSGHRGPVARCKEKQTLSMNGHISNTQERGEWVTAARWPGGPANGSPWPGGPVAWRSQPRGPGGPTKGSARPPGQPPPRTPCPETNNSWSRAGIRSCWSLGVWQLFGRLRSPVRQPAMAMWPDDWPSMEWIQPSLEHTDGRTPLVCSILVTENTM